MTAAQRVGLLEGEPQHRIDGRALTDDGDLVDNPDGASVADGNHAAVIRDTAGKDIKKGGLARAVAAEQRNLLTRLDIEGYAIQDEPVAIIFCQVLYGNVGHGGDYSFHRSFLCTSKEKTPGSKQRSQYPDNAGYTQRSV